MNYSLNDLLFASGHASANFAQQCLEPFQGNKRAISSFVTPEKEIMHWHEFGDLEGPGWAANAVGGGHLLYSWGNYCSNDSMKEDGKLLLRHVLEDGFVDHNEGCIWPYYDLSNLEFCWNYVHRLDWLCPGSLAKIGIQLLEFAGDLGDCELSKNMVNTALNLSDWMYEKVDTLENGWLPRRITPQGEPFLNTPDGGVDPIFNHSGDGLFLFHLWAMLAAQGHHRFEQPAIYLGNAFIQSGGFFGSINHDTYDSHESVAYACAFRIFNQMAEIFGNRDWKVFAYEKVLPNLDHFRISESRQGLPVKGLIWMEESWNTAYLWENAEVSQAYLEAWIGNGNEVYLQKGLEILEAVIYHHHGAFGFLTEGVDWDNHVGQQHHVNGKLYEDIQYTEPLLNNLHILLPTLTYFMKTQIEAPKIDADQAIKLVFERSKNSREI